MAVSTPLLLLVGAVFLIVVASSSSSSSFVSALDLVDITSIQDYERLALGDEYHAALIYFYANWDKEHAPLKKVVQQAADQMTDEHVSGLVMGLVDVGRHPEIARSTGVKGLPALLLYQFGTVPRRYAGAYHANSFTVESVIEFAVAEAHLHRKKLTKIREALQEKERTNYDFPHPNPGAIIELDSRNFNRVIRDPTKTAFVMYYAAWCDICKDTMPAVQKLAEYFKEDGGVVIGRMEVDNNQEWLDANGLQLEGVPTFYLYPRGRRDKEKGWLYVGDREFEQMSVYINGNNRKGEQDIDDFHRSIIKNKPHDSQLPEYMRGTKFTEKDAMPDSIFDKDGFPHGASMGIVKNSQPMNNIAEGRSLSAKTNAQRKFDEETASMTDEEKEEYKIRMMKQQKRINQGGNPMGASGLPHQMKGVID